MNNILKTSINTAVLFIINTTAVFSAEDNINYSLLQKEELHGSSKKNIDIILESDAAFYVIAGLKPTSSHVQHMIRWINNSKYPQDIRTKLEEQMQNNEHHSRINCSSLDFLDIRYPSSLLDQQSVICLDCKKYVYISLVEYNHLKNSMPPAFSDILGEFEYIQACKIKGHSYATPMSCSMNMYNQDAIERVDEEIMKESFQLLKEKFESEYPGKFRTIATGMYYGYPLIGCIQFAQHQSKLVTCILLDNIHTGLSAPYSFRIQAKKDICESIDIPYTVRIQDNSKFFISPEDQNKIAEHLIVDETFTDLIIKQTIFNNYFQTLMPIIKEKHLDNKERRELLTLLMKDIESFPGKNFSEKAWNAAVSNVTDRMEGRIRLSS